MEGVPTRRAEDLVPGPRLRGHLQEPDLPHLPGARRRRRVVPREAVGTPDRIPTCGWTLIQKVREDRRAVNVNVVAATGVKREVFGIDVGTSEDGAFWLALLRSLTARGFSGVQLVTSDVHQGLKDAIATVFAGASWQRCRTHFMTNLLSKVPPPRPALGGDHRPWSGRSTGSPLLRRSTHSTAAWWACSTNASPRPP